MVTTRRGIKRVLKTSEHLNSVSAENTLLKDLLLWASMNCLAPMSASLVKRWKRPKVDRSFPLFFLFFPFQKTIYSSAITSALWQKRMIPKRKREKKARKE